MRKKNKFLNWLTKVATAQAYITCASMPILAFWGLPISYLTFLGNIIANPFIATYIFISALLLFTEILGIPNYLIIKFLELNTFIILKFIKLGSNKWLFGVPQNYLLILIPFAATFIIFYFKDIKRLALLLLLLIVSTVTIKLLPIAPFKEILKCQNSKVTIFNSNRETKIYCKRNIFNNQTANRWLEYKLVPFLYQKTGSNRVKAIYFDKMPSEETLLMLNKHLEIDQIKAN